MKCLQWLLFSILLAASAGVLWTSAFAWMTIHDHAYITWDLPNNALGIFVDATREGALVGALIGGILLAGAVVIRLVWRAALLEHAGGWLPYVLCMAFTLCVIGAQATAHGYIGTLRTWGVIFMAAFWCGLFVTLRSRFVVRHRFFSTFITTNLYAVPALTLALALFIPPEKLHLIRRPETVIAAAATYVVCWFTVGWVSHRDSEMMPRPPWLLIAPALLPWIALVASPMLIEPGLALNRPTNLLLIGIDTLRVDHTSLLAESERQTSPHLSALAARGTFFEAAISQAPWTMPAFGSVMTGRYPREHGAISLSGKLRSTELTLAELLREAGFDTAGIVSHAYLDSVHGFDQGFDTYDETNVREHHDVTSADVTDLALAYLGKPHSKPFFVFLHYFDPHYEYRNHPDFDYADGYEGWLQDTSVDIHGLRDRRHDLSEADLDYLRDLYDEEIAFTDAQIGRILSYLRESGLDENTIIIVVADHGEEFMERGWLGHTTSLHEEQVRVPLIVALPAGEHQIRRVASVVETRAIFATVLDFMQPETRIVSLKGSLLPLMSGKAYGEAATPAYSEVWLPDANIDKRLRMSSVRTDRWKLIRNTTHDREYLYDLSIDPDERVDLLVAESERGKELRGLLEVWLRAMEEVGGEAPAAKLSEEQLQELRSLGYFR